MRKRKKEQNKTCLNEKSNQSKTRRRKNDSTKKGMHQ